MATGATHSYFGHDEWEPFAPGLKSIEDALEIRRRVLFAFEAAERETDPARRRAWLTFVIVGGGPTGVELAGALTEIARHALAKDFRHIDPTQAQVILLEGTARVLPATFPSSRRRRGSSSTAWASRSGRDSIVTAIDAEGVCVGSERIDAAHGPLGGGRGGLAAGAVAGRAARPRGPGPRRARPDHPRSSRGLRHRRPRAA